MADNHLPASKNTLRWKLAGYFFISGLLTASWTSRIPDVQEKLGLGNAQLGSVLFAVPVGLITGLAVASWLVALYGSRRVMLVSCLLSALLLALTGLVSSALLLVPVLWLLGLCRTVFNLAANTNAIEVQRLYQKPIVSTFHGVWSMACFAAAGISTGMIVLGVAPQFHLPGIALVAAAVALTLFEKNAEHTAPKERPPFFVMPDRYLFLLGLMALCAMLCEGAVFDWSVNYFEKVVKAKTSLRTAGYLSFIITMAAGRLAGDRLIHRFGAPRLLLLNGVLMASGFFLAAAFPYVLPAVVGFSLIGAGSSVLVPVIYLLASRTKKMATGYALSSVTLIGYAGFLAGPLLMGNVTQRFGMPAAFFMLSVAGLLLTALAARVQKPAVV